MDSFLPLRDRERFRGDLSVGDRGEPGRPPFLAELFLDPGILHLKSSAEGGGKKNIMGSSLQVTHTASASLPLGCDLGIKNIEYCAVRPFDWKKKGLMADGWTVTLTGWLGAN